MQADPVAPENPALILVLIWEEIARIALAHLRMKPTNQLL